MLSNVSGINVFLFYVTVNITMIRGFIGSHVKFYLTWL